MIVKIAQSRKYKLVLSVVADLVDEKIYTQVTLEEDKHTSGYSYDADEFPAALRKFDELKSRYFNNDDGYFTSHI